jgi:hypothetical protein
MTTDMTGGPGGEAALAAAAPVPQGFFRRNRWKFILVGVLGGGLGLFALYTMAALRFAYSSGERVGYVQKLSKKGWVCRTWEGELAMSPVPGAAPQIFAFSLRDDAMAQQISAAEGKRVTLQYEEKMGIPSSCFGDTKYFVVGLRILAH